MQAIGRVAVSLYLGRCCYGPRHQSGYWLRLAERLPAAARRFVRLCFDAEVRVATRGRLRLGGLNREGQVSPPLETALHYGQFTLLIL